MEEQRIPARAGQKRVAASPKKAGKKPRIFLIVYLVILALLLTGSFFTLRYVHNALERYEASQPENVLAAQLQKLREMEAQGRFEEVMSMEKIRAQTNATEEEVVRFQKSFLESTVTFQEDRSAPDLHKKTYNILSDGVPVATITLDHQGQESLLLIFTMDLWSVGSMEVTGYPFRLTAPAAAIIKGDGRVLTGEPAEGGISYDVRTLAPMDVQICDILGNSVPYDPENLPSFTDYKVTVPSTFTVQGIETVPLEEATLQPIDALKYVKEYCPQVPDTAIYVLSILADAPPFRILDGSGKEVAYTLEGRTVTVDGIAGQDTAPDFVDIDPLKVAKLWSLFMTQDLSGSNNGYGQILPYLIEDSYLQGVVWKWATGIDITFTSAHKLKDPPFQVAEISNYVVYSDDCFSCDIHLEKVMVLTHTGAQVNDVINSTFYFVNYDDTDNGKDDPHWALVDYREIS